MMKDLYFDHLSDQLNDSFSTLVTGEDDSDYKNSNLFEGGVMNLGRVAVVVEEEGEEGLMDDDGGGGGDGGDGVGMIMMMRWGVVGTVGGVGYHVIIKNLLNLHVLLIEVVVVVVVVEEEEERGLIGVLVVLVGLVVEQDNIDLEILLGCIVVVVLLAVAVAAAVGRKIH